MTSARRRGSRAERRLGLAARLEATGPTIRALAIVVGLGLVVTGLLIRGTRVASMAHPRPAAGSTAPATTTTTTIPVSSVIPIGPELISNPTLIPRAGSDVAIGLQVWGQAPALAVSRQRSARGGKKGHHGTTTVGYTQSVSLARHHTGGVWFTINVRPGRIYEAAVALRVLELPAGASVVVRLEWYPAASSASGAIPAIEAAPSQTLTSATGKTITVTEAGEAPLHTATVHEVVNVIGGGKVVISHASLRLARRR